MMLNENADMLMQEHGNDFPIVIYCDGGECSASKDLKKFLTVFGFTDVYIFPGGIAEWNSQDLPLTK